MPSEEKLRAQLDAYYKSLATIDTLSEKERDIITLRFGLNDTAPMSLKEIGEMYNLTKERIRQIEKRALERLKQPGRAKMLESYTA